MTRQRLRKLPTPTLAGCVLSLALSSPLAGQLGERSAQEWAGILDAEERTESLQTDAVLAAVGFRPGNIVADIGAGVGVFSVPIARAVRPNGVVLAVEVDPEFLPLIQEKAKGEGASNVYPVLGQFGDPMLPRRDVDIAFFHDVLHHIENRARYLRSLASYMARESRIVVIDHRMLGPDDPRRADGMPMSILREDVDDWMTAAGFQLEQEIGLFEDKTFVVYRRTR